MVEKIGLEAKGEGDSTEWGEGKKAGQPKGKALGGQGVKVRWAGLCRVGEGGV